MNSNSNKNNQTFPHSFLKLLCNYYEQNKRQRGRVNDVMFSKMINVWKSIQYKNRFYNLLHVAVCIVSRTFDGMQDDSLPAACELTHSVPGFIKIDKY